MKIVFEEELGSVAVLRRYEVGAEDLPILLQPLVPVAIGAIETAFATSPTPDAGTLRLMVGGKSGTWSEWEVPAEIRPLIAWFRDRAKPVPFI